MLDFVPGGGGPTFYYLAACVAGGLAFVLPHGRHARPARVGLSPTATELDEVI